MTLAIRTSPATAGYAIDCRRAVIQAYARGVATVLTVRGSVDALNDDCVYRHLYRFTRLETALIIDITEAAVADLDTLRSFAAGDLGTVIAIVARPEDAAEIRASADGPAVPVHRTVAEAVQALVRDIQARRGPRALPLLRLA
ncbi:hypothetical protein [Mycolicibacterium komossense]|uniref:Uncharacterized protein n=1 Tax=Mycolicibacterium komossense TaxID=1779 RepID=A0ABT3CEK9_9MYCO|nr:hypothetical protein [Mycolicibacterium komossense]MCV7227924.1 hypothetical protein [Mycolicibacterium komossense]